MKHLFREGRALGTILLWIIFFCSLLDIFFLSSWLPTVLHDAGLSISASVVETALFQGGGVVAGLTLGLVIDRAGFLKVLVPVYIGAGLAIGSIGFAGTSLGLIMIASFLSGAFVIGGQNSVNVLAAVFYPTYIRATGVGWALGIGRFGSIVGPIVGGVLLQAHWDRTIAVHGCRGPGIRGCRLRSYPEFDAGKRSRQRVIRRCSRTDPDIGSIRKMN